MAQSLVQISNFVVFSRIVFDWSTVEGAYKLDACDGALSGAGSTQLLRKDRVVDNTQVFDLGELVKSVEALPVVNQVVLHREHVQVLEAWLVVNLAYTILVQGQALQILEMTEFDHLIPGANVVSL